MPYHLHFADSLWTATNDIQYHTTQSDEPVLGVHLVVDEASHDHVVWGPWQAVCPLQYHEQYADNVEIYVSLTELDTVHRIFDEEPQPLPILQVDETYHVSGADVIWATPIPEVKSTFHLVIDTQVNPTGTIKLLPDDSIILATVDADLPSMEAEGFGGGYADIELPMFESSMSGYLNQVGTVDARLPVMSAVGYGGANGSFELPMLTAEGSITVGKVGNVNATLPRMSATGTGFNSSASNVDAILPGFSVVATGFVEIIANADITLPNLTATSEATSGITGEYEGTLPLMTAAGTGYTIPTGDVDANLPMIVAEISGTSNLARYCDTTLKYTR